MAKPPKNQNQLASNATLAENLEAVFSISNDSQWIVKLAALMPHLPSEMVSRSVELLNSLPDGQQKAWAIEVIAPFARESDFGHLLKIIEGIEPEDLQARGLNAVGPYLPTKFRQQALDMADKLQVEDDRIYAWAGMGAFLPTDKKQMVVSNIDRFHDYEQRAEIIIEMVPHLPNAWKKQMLDATYLFPDEDRVRVISAIIPHLPKSDRGAILNETLRLCESIEQPESRVAAYTHIIPLLPKRSQSLKLSEAMAYSDKIEDHYQRILLQLDLATLYPPGRRRRTAYEMVLSSISELNDEENLLDVMFRVATTLPTDLHPLIREVIDRIPDPKLQVSVINRVDNLLGEVPSAASQGSVVVQGNKNSIENVDINIPDEADVEDNDEDVLGKISKSSTGTAPPKSGSKSKRGDRKTISPTETDITDDQPEALQSEETSNTATFLHSDKWTLDDRLNYVLYAKSLAEFIGHNDTRPPLTAGILAPWGHGKTTLMRLLQYQLWRKAMNREIQALESGSPEQKKLVDEYLGQGLTVVEETIDDRQILKVKDTAVARKVFLEKRSQRPSARPVVIVRELLNWMQSLVIPADADGRQLDRELKEKLPRLKYPTIWFNAWKYQKSEEIWAGMAHSIISQLVAQIPSELDRERFWLALQAERLDFNAIRRDIHRTIFEKFLPKALYWLVLGVVGILLIIIGIPLAIFAENMTLQNLLSGCGWIATAGSVIGTVWQWIKTRGQVENNFLEGKFAQYVRQPDYAAKSGYFYEVEQDVRRVFDLLVDPDYPAVVFIDDLDRCAPGTVAEVIEAVNLFLSGDFPNSYFVMGVDAQVVAASMEVAYEKLTAKLQNVTRNYGSLGWYFMDKFIQLQFMIPNISADQRREFLDGLFHQEIQGEATAEEVTEAAKKLQQAVQQESDPDVIITKNKPALKLLQRQRPEEFGNISQQLLEKTADQLTDDNPEISKYLARYESYLGRSPRGMKRFANLYRFYGLTQQSRKIQDLPYAPQGALARWLVIMLRWPQLVRWIQWEGEVRITGAGSDPTSRAREISRKIRAAKDHADWQQMLKAIGADNIEWLNDRQLFEFLRDQKGKKERLEYAVEVGVW